MKKILEMILIGTLLISMTTGCGNKNNSNKGVNEENKQNDVNNQVSLLEKKLETIGKYFYETLYYTGDSIGKTEEEKIKFVSKYKDIGIKINLQELSNVARYKNEINENFINCDFKNTKAIFYPKEPYGSTDYEVVADLHCVFDE